MKTILGRMAEYKEKFIPPTDKIKHRCPFVPDGFRRAIVCGRSESGKTCMLPDLIPRLAPATYLFIFTPNLDQSPLRYIQEQHYATDPEKNKCITSDVLDMNLIDGRSDKLREHSHNIVIIDDFIDTRQLEEMVPLWTRGRHLNISCFCLIQRYYNLPKTIRENSTDLFLFPSLNANRILADIPIDGIGFEKLKKLYKEMVSAGNYSFLWLCMTPYIHPVYRVRKGFEGILSQYLIDE